MQEALDQAYDNFPISQIFTESFDITAIGSITIVNDTIKSPEPQLVHENSDEALQFNNELQEHYNDIQEYLQQANTDKTEMKKKKKKKKANLTSTPENPILFYVWYIHPLSPTPMFLPSSNFLHFLL